MPIPLEYAQGESQCDYFQSAETELKLALYKKQNLPSVTDILEKIRETELEQKMESLTREWNPCTPTERLLVEQIYYHGLVNDTKNMKTAIQTLLRLKQYRACTTENNRLAVINPNWS
jgi:hypothetical protein